ncbi:hypothetical protein V8E55_001415 [Tylopilus felleus]
MTEQDYFTFACPQCQNTFPSPGVLSGHINDTGGSCYLSNIPYPDIRGHYHPTSAYVYGKGKTLLDKMQANIHERRREHVVYYPFADEGEWELSKFLLQHLPQTAIKDFLKLKWSGHPSVLPSGPSWKATTLEIEGCKANRPVQLILQDPKEVVEDLLSNPMFTNHMKFDPHAQLPVGAMIIPIILGHTGGLQMHLSDVRMQATSHTWRCVTFIPTPTFDIHPDYQTPLTSRVFHQCMDICALNGSPMTDALGYTHSCYTPLVAYIADLLEHTLKQIEDLCLRVNPWDVAIQLLGVHLPFWRNWRFADPAFFLIGEILHTCHKFFFDHILKWCKETQHKCVGTQHFASGMTHIKQMTGREHRDIQRTIVPMISKATSQVTPLFVYCIQAQSPVHSDASLAAMVGALQEFHATCHTVVDAESDFNIPKLGLFQSFTCNITNNGNLIQYTTDVSDTFTNQIIAILNREESMRRFDLYHILRHATAPLEHEISTINPMLSLISSITPEEEISIQGPRFLSVNGVIAFHVTVKPDRADVLVEEMQHLYDLPYVMQHIVDLWSPHSGKMMQHSSFRSRFITKCQVVQAYLRDRF